MTLFAVVRSEADFQRCNKSFSGCLDRETQHRLFLRRHTITASDPRNLGYQAQTPLSLQPIDQAPIAAEGRRKGQRSLSGNLEPFRLHVGLIAFRKKLDVENNLASILPGVLNDDDSVTRHSEKIVC